MPIAGRNHRRKRPQRDGYVLLMTLILIVVAAISQAGLARRSLLSALAAKDAQDELQRRWGATTCRRMLLDHAPELFIKLEDPGEEERPSWPTPASAAGEFALGGFQARVLLADESAKLNLNAAYAKAPENVAQLLAERMIPATELRPDLSRTAQLRRRWFSSWGQVFQLERLLEEETGAAGFEQLARATAGLTCWGSGKVNVRRAADQTLLAAGASAVGADVGRKLVAARAEFAGDLLLPALMEGLELRRTDQLKLRSQLTDASSCWSLWLELRHESRTWYYLWIAGDRVAGGQAPYLLFTW